MQFVVHLLFDPEQRDAAQARFAETGALPPQGVKMTGRWHSVHGKKCFWYVRRLTQRLWRPGCNSGPIF